MGMKLPDRCFPSIRKALGSMFRVPMPECVYMSGIPLTVLNTVRQWKLSSHNRTPSFFKSAQISFSSISVLWLFSLDTNDQLGKELTIFCKALYINRHLALSSSFYTVHLRLGVGLRGGRGWGTEPASTWSWCKITFALFTRRADGDPNFCNV